MFAACIDTRGALKKRKTKAFPDALYCLNAIASIDGDEAISELISPGIDSLVDLPGKRDYRFQMFIHAVSVGE